MKPIIRLEFDAAELVEEYPPAFRFPLKCLVYDIASDPDVPPSGTIHVTRWAESPLPAWDGVSRTEFSSRPGVFGYETPPKGTISWHMNFAAAEAFGYYAGPLLAQDELQVVEHPALASVREALLAQGEPARTVDEGRPTPLLVRGVERRCVFHTEPDAVAGRPHGLYGNRFAGASPMAVGRAVELIEPPTRSNILAMEAPSLGSGEYEAEDLHWILSTAITGYLAAIYESQLEQRGARTEIHTGYWGCGAYGGDPMLMAVLQALAARLASVDRLVFHLGQTHGAKPYDDAMDLIEDRFEPGTPRTADSIVEELLALAFAWGEGDGN